MKKTNVLNDFEKTIEQKYGHMAESMLEFYRDFKNFIITEDIDLTNFDMSFLDELFDEYLDYIGLTDAEFSMVFQMLIEFCDYCNSKNIDLSLFKNHLLNQKETLYEYWTEGDDEELLDDFPDEFFDMKPEYILENFDRYYDIMKLGMTNKTIAIKKIQSDLEGIYAFLQTGLTVSSELCENNPKISKKELQKNIEKKMNTVNFPLLTSDDIIDSMFSLPKKQSKRFMEFMMTLDKNLEFNIISEESNDVMQNTLDELKSLIDDIKSLKTNVKK
ncbi:MAG: hypothetical protein V1769_07060 [Thermoplasmatota archaeon]